MYMLLCHTDGSIEHQCITHVCCLARPHLSKVLVWATRLRRQQRSGWRWSTRAATTALMSSNGKVYGATRIKCLLAWHVFQHTVSSPAVPVKHLRIFSDGHCRLVVVHASKLSSKSCLYLGGLQQSLVDKSASMATPEWCSAPREVSYQPG